MSLSCMMLEMGMLTACKFVGVRMFIEEKDDTGVCSQLVLDFVGVRMFIEEKDNTGPCSQLVLDRFCRSKNVYRREG